MRALAETLDLLDLAIARGAGLAAEETLAEAAAVVANARSREAFLGDVLIVALAGGTGSGKSSLLNALAGTELASVSPLRPHTDEPLAWVAADAMLDAAPLLDELGVADRVENDQLPGVVVIDLPDMDSIAEWHRRIVADLLPRVDAVVWVFDPEKYNDPSLHDGFLRPLASYHRQFVFVLNKIDRLPGDDLPVVLSHLASTLEAGGHPAPRVVPTAAAPPDGGAVGVEELIKHMDRRLDAKLAAHTKVVEDIHGIARSLAAGEGLWSGWVTGFDGLGEEPAVALRRLIAAVGPVTGRRLAELGGDELNGARREAAVAALLWDRALFAATLASVGVATTSLMADLDARRIP